MWLCLNVPEIFRCAGRHEHRKDSRKYGGEWCSLLSSSCTTSHRKEDATKTMIGDPVISERLFFCPAGTCMSSCFATQREAPAPAAEDHPCRWGARSSTSTHGRALPSGSGAGSVCSRRRGCTRRGFVFSLTRILVRLLCPDGVCCFSNWQSVLRTTCGQPSNGKDLAFSIRRAPQTLPRKQGDNGCPHRTACGTAGRH